jgi:hypothetical protein
MGKILGGDLVGSLDDLELSKDIALARMTISTDVLAPTGPSKLRIADFNLYEKAQNLVPSHLRRLVKVQGRHVLLEYKEFIPVNFRQPVQSSHEKTKQLSQIVHAAKPERYHTLRCDGYYICDSHFVLAFSIPRSINPSYTTLSSILRDSSQLPSLDQRFVLARKLCTT